MSFGKLTSNGVHLQQHEFKTVQVLLQNGYDVELLHGPAVSVKGLRTPDIMIGGIPWEIKAPEGAGQHTIKHNLQNAARQAENVIIDLFRCKVPEYKAIKEIRYHFDLSKRIKRLKVITKDKIIIDLSKHKGVS